ncbi:methionine--tRNA ligase subunit beta [Candidatus Bathyarchaeota archaeon]|jgi:tRNA-binding protein|nr:MAG: methionine--tRNA ligase subunit beta [Candidatus Bathyarchaeota archaeon]
MSEEVAYKDFKRLDIRIGTIKSCERVEGSDKLYRIKVDCGEPELRQILSSLVDYYTAEELVGKVIPVIVNLKPAKIFGELSHGMLLAAEIGDKCVLLTTDKPIENGARIT